MTRPHRALALMALPLMVGCDQIQLTENGVAVDFAAEDIPLLPPGFPIYPKAFSTASLDAVLDEVLDNFTYKDAIEGVLGDACITVLGTSVCGDDLMTNSKYDAIDQAIFDDLPEVEEWIRGHLIGQLNFYNPGPLASGVNEQLGRFLRGKVVFDEVKLDMAVSNKTDRVWGVPVRLKMYVGDGGTVAAKGGLVTAEDGADYTVMLLPGESAEVTTGNMAGLVTALNDVRSLSLDYDADIEATDLSGSDLTGFLSASKDDADGNGVADGLAQWGLVFDEFKLSVSGRGEIEFPDGFPEWTSGYTIGD